MRFILRFPWLCPLIVTQFQVPAAQTPTNLISQSGDQSIILHWDQGGPGTVGYKVYLANAASGPFALLNSTGLVTTAGYCDLSSAVVNGQTNFYQVSAVDSASQESAPTAPIPALPHSFASDAEFLEYLQQANFDYFWYLANPANGLVPDRSAQGSACSIAAVGFGLTAINIAIDHEWITRTQGSARVLTTLNTFLNGPEGPEASGVIGYKGWFYHFLDMNTAVRATAELSSIDTALLLAGVVDAKQYFDGTNSEESSIRAAADAILDRVDWNWMAQGTNLLSMGWYPSSGFLPGKWMGYNEGMILYCLGLGARSNALPATAWQAWTSGYQWGTFYGYSYVIFPPLFAHQYSHCWIDFRHIRDEYMNAHGSSYFENSRRASLAQRAYCIANPLGRVGYSGTVWGLTACDSPSGYLAHGAPPAQDDDGTIAPTAAGGSIAFVPEYSVPTLRYFYDHFRPRLWTAYGFRDGFNIGAQWVGPDELGIDQGPIVIMVENYRSQNVWRRFMQNEVVQQGLQRAGFVPMNFAPARVQANLTQGSVSVSWQSPAAGTYQVEYSPDLVTWFNSPTGDLNITNSVGTWTDTGPPATSVSPASTTNRFYRVLQLAPQ